jgi:hypothetical protein
MGQRECVRKNGIMEYWNDGTMEKKKDKKWYQFSSLKKYTR